MAINAGSSSLKFQVFEAENLALVAKGLFERIGLSQEVVFSFSTSEKKAEKLLPLSHHEEVVTYFLQFLTEQNILHHLTELIGVGHRVAHGGEHFKTAALVGCKEIQKIDELGNLAPLHNPVNLIGIRAFQKALPELKQVAVFDTSFHQTMTAQQFVYPIPYEFYEKDGIRKYGFHGTSHQFIGDEVSKLLGEPLEKLKIISCHLGNGASICAIKAGKSFATSMGFTPLAGLMMGTRCGDIDPSVLTYLQREKGYSYEALDQMMNKKSGFLGISNISNDSRDLIKASEAGNARAKLALDIFTDRVKSTIGAYAALMGGVDVLVFTAGIGENSAWIREKCCENLEFLGIRLDDLRNQENQKLIQQEGEKVQIMVIPTNEELMIAKETIRLIKAQV
jgi:acetate kinase/propionate kinase